MISSEPCAFVGPSHECTASVASRNWVLGLGICTGLACPRPYLYWNLNDTPSLNFKCSNPSPSSMINRWPVDFRTVVRRVMGLYKGRF
ncbi:hypothetical protein SLEP1_g3742 [Rubroshorea leprosula]|uniref:Uncharacterized protein n=1 Tax=Rubroshorea leprosula TaxID=152421 RepID=A0AAV5HLZ0_9ROSI|nr:hypothetical protein SLEP1_g3742 [Rubroshorea leprosula]